MISCFGADSDDVIVGGEKIRDIASRAKKMGMDCVFFDYWYGCDFDGEPSLETLKNVDIIQQRERLIDPQVYVWKKRIHETPVPVENYEPKYTYASYKDNGVVWVHLGADRNMPMGRSAQKNG
ncbi:MAG: hypothetical protein KatS3mg101_0955 [Patescibacteria group bacterium]|nr:MAG: hypothetical protein KatS3mg101_0955 [Patescibacteria group bacterium]